MVKAATRPQQVGRGSGAGRTASLPQKKIERLGDTPQETSWVCLCPCPCRFRPDSITITIFQHLNQKTTDMIHYRLPRHKYSVLPDFQHAHQKSLTKFSFLFPLSNVHNSILQRTGSTFVSQSLTQRSQSWRKAGPSVYPPEYDHLHREADTNRHKRSIGILSHHHDRKAEQEKAYRYS